MRDLSGWGFTTCGERLRQHCNPREFIDILPRMATRSTHSRKFSRRGVLKKAAAGAAAVSISVSRPRAAKAAAPKGTFVLCLNTSTIRGQKLPLTQEIDLAAKAGFTAMEPWVGEIG